MNKLPAPSERQIQADCIQLLRMKGYYVQRLNSGAIRIGEGRAARMIQLSEVGTPDLMAFKPHELAVGLLFIEVKRPGNKPTIHQEQKMQELESYGAKCVVAHSAEELEGLL